MTDTEVVMRDVKPYAWKQFPRSVPLPPDIREAIHPTLKPAQGMVLVWASSAAAAARRLESVHLDPVKARDLEPVDGLDVRLIQAAKDWPAGTVLATNNWGDAHVVEITDRPADRDDLLRVVTPVGFMHQFMAMFRLNKPEATQVMIDAAIQATRDRYTYVQEDSIRAIIGAALRAGGYA